MVGIRVASTFFSLYTLIVPTALHGAEAWGMRSAERRKVNVLEMKCLRSMVGVSRMDRVRNEEVWMRAGMNNLNNFISTRHDTGYICYIGI